jgi:hypothetical protein
LSRREPKSWSSRCSAPANFPDDAWQRLREPRNSIASLTGDTKLRGGRWR